MPIGVQLYQLSDELNRDLAGSLKKIAAIGYSFVEAPSFYGAKPAVFGDSLKAAGLSCIGGGVVPNSIAPGDKSLETHSAQLFDDFVAAGFTDAVCVIPPLPKRMRSAMPASVEEAFSQFTAADWREAGTFLNAAGEQAKKAGLQLAYHNHGWEFRPAGSGGELGYDILAASTDPSLVQFELDCGWVASQGLDPTTYVRKYGQRISFMHIKDIARPLQPGERLQTVAVGKGIIDWPSLFAAAKGTALRHYYVELEPPFDTVWQTVRESHDYLQSLKV
ncbi:MULTISPECIES: sugar phosphate isomerase/epimerase [Rhodomicrobium]|uniref:sugar phosphate isomerase/epimerase family protein n=1 Tax=Rhodomicrobium TaxID=1068 RepID=UPI000B4BD945|nr:MULTISPECIES: sugar phosphate isomerase/epimerase [Rhodomicrobium]